MMSARVLSLPVWIARAAYCDECGARMAGALACPSCAARARAGRRGVLPQLRPRPAAEQPARGETAIGPMGTRTRFALAPGGGAVMTVGVLNIVLAAVGLVIPLVVWFVLKASDERAGSHLLPFATAALLASHQALLLVAGMGLVLQRSWGRVLSLIWAGISSIALVAVFVAALSGVGPFDARGLSLVVVVGACSAMLIYPVLLVLLLSIPAYRRALGETRSIRRAS